MVTVVSVMEFEAKRWIKKRCFQRKFWYLLKFSSNCKYYEFIIFWITFELTILIRGNVKPNLCYSILGIGILVNKHLKKTSKKFGSQANFTGPSLTQKKIQVVNQFWISWTLLVNNIFLFDTYFTYENIFKCT